MSEHRRDALTRRVLTALRMTVIAVGVASAVLGYVGLRAFLRGRPSLGISHAPGDLVYFDAEMFLLQSPPLGFGGPFPWTLALARFTAPIVAGYGLLELGALLFASRARRARVRRYRGHVIVCGATRTAAVLADKLRAEHPRVVTILPEGPRPEYGDVIVGDPSDRRTLLDAGVTRAQVVYACLDNGPSNVRVAAQVQTTCEGTPRPPKVYALIRDVEVCAHLRARRWSLAEPDWPKLDVFNPDELAAHATVRADQVGFDGEPPEIIIVGTGAFGRAVLVEFARRWNVRGDISRRPLRAVLLGRRAADVAALLRCRYPFLAGACEVTPRRVTLRQFARERNASHAPPAARLYLCQEDEEEAFKSALDSIQLWRAPPEQIVVRLSRLAELGRPFHATSGEQLFDAMGGRLRIVDVVATGCDPKLIRDDLAEYLARGVHEHYLRQAVLKGAELGSSPALTPWEHLPDEYRLANREHGEDVGRKLARIDCVLISRSGEFQDFRYLPAEVEFLAQQEHNRWMAERQRTGWTHGVFRDDERRLHPSLVPWARLPDAEREKDRDAVRALPEILADVGLAITRLHPSRFQVAGTSGPSTSAPRVSDGRD